MKIYLEKESFKNFFRNRKLFCKDLIKLHTIHYHKERRIVNISFSNVVNTFNKQYNNLFNKKEKGYKTFKNIISFLYYIIKEVKFTNIKSISINSNYFKSLISISIQYKERKVGTIKEIKTFIEEIEEQCRIIDQEEEDHNLLSEELEDFRGV